VATVRGSDVGRGGGPIDGKSSFRSRLRVKEDFNPGGGRQEIAIQLSPFCRAKVGGGGMVRGV